MISDCRCVGRRRGRAPRALVLAAFVACALASCSVDVATGLGERDANEILVVLEAAGIPATRVDGDGWEVTVPRSQERRALQVLVSRSLPRRPTHYEELLSEGGGVVPSPEAERTRRTALVEESLERTLLSLAGVYDAHVHAVLPGEDSSIGRREPPAPARMSIVVVELDETAPPDDAVRAIAAGAVDGLEPARIVVVRSRVDLPAPADTSLVAVGPVAVAAESAVLVRAIAGVGAGLVIALAAAVVVLVLRRGEP